MSCNYPTCHIPDRIGAGQGPLNVTSSASIEKAGQVLAPVQATSTNPLDFQVRRGDYRDLAPLPAITGHDVSCVGEAVGLGVEYVKILQMIGYARDRELTRRFVAR